MSKFSIFDYMTLAFGHKKHQFEIRGYIIGIEPLSPFY